MGSRLASERTVSRDPAGLPPGGDAGEASDPLTGFNQRQVIQRIWQRDHTLWRPDSREIANRLGWLDIAGAMQAEAPGLALFSDEIRREGYRHVVLLGMGGSSLGPEALGKTFTPIPGYPELIVLDSTVPAQVRAVTGTIDPARTLFLVSSKSGGTIETLSLYRYFRGVAEEVLSEAKAGRNFVAITDSGTPLEVLGGQAGFRRVFLNDPDIGGRYSALSYFGLVPAALAGIDVAGLLARALGMRKRCQAADIGSNPGAQLGAFISANALAGRDKLTLIEPPSIRSLGLWVEQLIAESLGKDGKGIIPIAGEPLLAPDAYDADRLFVYSRAASDADPGVDAAVDRLEAAGHPVERLELRDNFDLGAEFFRWEFAAAVAGAVLDVHPFDQPDVQSSKDITERLLADFIRDARLPEPLPAGTLPGLLAQSKPGDYLAIMPYIPITPNMPITPCMPITREADDVLDQLRQRVMRRHRIATTVGYGPRFLHSTGQLHKGGSPSGLFLQLTMSHDDLPIPGRPYGFATLAAAQAVGDLQALSRLGRRTARIDLGSQPVDGLQRLLEQL